MRQGNIAAELSAPEARNMIRMFGPAFVRDVLRASWTGTVPPPRLRARWNLALPHLGPAFSSEAPRRSQHLIDRARATAGQRTGISSEEKEPASRRGDGQVLRLNGEH